LFFFEDKLPEVLAVLRKQLYRHLAPIANRWNEVLEIGYRYPDTLDSFLQANHDADQNRQLSHLHRLQESDYIALHQRNDGQLVFPLQAVLLLSEPGQDFRGGELVMTEQRPRMQSRPLVLSLQQGDIAIMSTGQRPFKGSHGFYRVNMKHAISRVRSGQRIGLELFFHHAPGDNQRDTHEQRSLLDTDRN
ncbi:2OG-Fe(II) oxygenase, partial [Advenella sp. FME57]|uniref:2OG-Fe(II) oxygenase n=1 Tax=Advenella sp. FME57 TaxID=2742604 RepID=UPI0018674FC5